MLTNGWIVSIPTLLRSQHISYFNENRHIDLIVWSDLS